MPYQLNDDLPTTIREALPRHGQDIYREAFNHAWVEYEDPQKRRTLESREEIAHKVAWSAVKRKYHKKNGDWVPDHGADPETA